MPIVQYRKGTRSRPQVKIPKQYHDDYEDVIQQPTSPLQSDAIDDPLIPIEIIKSEPIDVEENDISSFSVDGLETTTNTVSDASDSIGPPTLIPQEILNPLASTSNHMEMEEELSHHNDGFTRIKLTTEHLVNEQKAAEDSVASIQIAECHSMNLDEQEEEENRRLDAEEETKVDEGGGLERKNEESVVENHVGETTETEIGV